MYESYYDNFCLGPTGANLLSFLGVTEIENIFSRYGAVSNAKQIAISIVEQRYLNKNVQVRSQIIKISLTIIAS